MPILLRLLLRIALIAILLLSRHGVRIEVQIEHVHTVADCATSHKMVIESVVK